MLLFLLALVMLLTPANVLTASDVLALAEIRRKCADGRARSVRLTCDITHREIGARCGVAGSTVARWEIGERVPRGRPALRYARLIEALERQIATEKGQAAS